MSTLTDIDLEAAIARHPLMIAPNAPVVEAIALMSAGGTTCSFSCEVDSAAQAMLVHAQSSCVLVVEDNRLVGIVTERDLVRLSATGRNLADLAIAEVMVSPVLTLEVSEFKNLFVPLHLFQHHHIRHLPLLDQDGAVVGLITHDSLRQLLRPIDLLHLRVASEVMATEVIHTQPTATILELTQLMAKHRVSSVVIVATEEDHLVPLGIVTERDIVQFLALELDLAVIQAQAVMSMPVFSVGADISLWSVRILMQERQINRVVVIDEENRLLGIVTQTNLLNVLNPMEIYRMVETLEEKVSRLQAEKLKLLQTRNSELAAQVQERTAALQMQLERTNLLSQISIHLRSSVNLEDIFDTTVRAVREFLKCDRLLVYQFDPDFSGIVVAESVGEGWATSVNDHINDSCLCKKAAEFYGTGLIIAINNIYQEKYTECHLDLLEQYQVKAFLIVPILVSGKLWGLLIGHNCADYRIWHTDELAFLNEIGVQLAIAIQQATAHQKAQAELAERQKAEVALRESESLLSAMFEGSAVGIVIVDINGRFIRSNSYYQKMIGYSASELQNMRFNDITIEADQAENLRLFEELIRGDRQNFQMEKRYRHRDGHPLWVRLTSSRICSELAEPKLFVALVENISEYKQAESALQESEARLAEAQRVAQIGNWEFEITTGKITWSAELFRILGRDPAFGEPTYIENLQIYHPEDADKLHQAVERAVFNGESYQILLRVRACQADGSIQFVEAIARAELNNQGRVNRLFGTVQDVTSRVQTEKALAQLNQELEMKVAERTAALKESEKRWQLALKGTNDGIWDWDVINKRVFFSSRWKQMRGYNEAEIGDQLEEWSNRIHPDDYDRVMVAIDNHFRGQTDFLEVEYRVQCKDGSYFWVLDRGQALRDESGQVIRMSGSETNITERKEAEKQLCNLSDRLELAVKSAQIGIWDWDIVNDRLIWDDRMYELYGIKSSDFIGAYQAWEAGLHPDDLLTSRIAIQQAIAGENDFDPEFRVVWPDGTIKFIKAYALVQRDSQGQPQRMIGINFDISDRKLAEEALKASEQRYFSLAAAAPVGIFRTNAQGNCIYVNARWCELAGLSRESALGYGWENALHPEDRPAIAAQWYHCAQTGEMFNLEYRFLQPDGTTIWVFGQSVQEKDDNGTIIGYVGTVTDISDRKRLEQEQNRLIAILEASTDFIGMSDAAGNILWNNAEFRKLWELDSDATVKQRHISDYHPQWAIEFVMQQGLPSAIANGTWVGETALLNAQREEIPVSQLIIAHKSPQGEVEFFSTILRDIRVRKEYEQKLELSNAELTRATRLKDEFLANMSHELRTPLNAILGMSEGLQEEVFGILNEQQKKLIATIEGSGRHLLELINDILDVSKIEAGKLELNMTPVSVVQLCNSSLSFVRQQAIQKSIQLKSIFSEDLGEIIVDERRMRQVLINLLNNAVKFTPNGGQVTLYVYLEYVEVYGADKDHPSSESEFLYSLCFSVIDTGIGIAAADQNKLFQPFTQIDSSLSRKYTGTGLGLTLVKQIVELHGASITVTSELDKGSCFTVRLPYILKQPIAAIPSPTFVPTVTQAVIAAPEPVTNRPLILLVEDNQTNIDTFWYYLESHGYDLILATNGQEAIKLATTQAPHLILMDIQMSEMDGLEAMRQIRANPQLASIPIIALTALAMPGDQEKCLEAGANEYLSKPVKLKQLAEMIQEILGNRK